MSDTPGTTDDPAAGRDDVPETGFDDEQTVMYRPGEVPAAEVSERGVTGAFRYALTIDRGPRAGLSFVLGDGETTVGRAADCTIFLGDVTVSRHHAKLTVEGDALTIEDLGSTNGTYVNGERYDSRELDPGDEVIIGKYHLIVARGAL